MEQAEQFRLTKEEEAKIREIKNSLHCYPELAFQESRTTALIREELQELEGVEILSLGMETGVVARLCGGQEGKTVGLRADIDGIAQREDESISLRSKRLGLMHGCGHDFHTASLLGAARILSRNREKLKGTVIFLFQPAEETTKGAQAMIAAGLFQKVPMDFLFGLHNRPEVPAGQVVVQKGSLMAGKYNFQIILHGVGGHGSMPHKCADPIVCGAAMIQSLQTVVSRNTDPLQGLVLTIGSIHGGTPDNLVVDRLTMTGCMRALQEETRQMALRRMKQIVAETASMYECEAEFVIEQEIPPCVNGEAMYRLARKASVGTVGESNTIESEPTLASEDFAVLAQHVPGFFYWVGSGFADRPVYSWHHRRFCTNDDGLKVGAELLAQSVLAATTAEESDVC